MPVEVEGNLNKSLEQSLSLSLHAKEAMIRFHCVENIVQS